MAQVIQLSDPHLSHARGFFVENFRSAAAEVAGTDADLVIVSGDLSIDGADSDDDLAFARHMFARLGERLAVIPGNHDIGEEPGAIHTGQPADATRLQRYLGVFGTDRFMRDVGAWRLIGINAHLFGTGLPREAEQWSWLLDWLGETGKRPVGLFLHKPLFIDAPDETPDGLVSVPREARDRLLALTNAHAIGFLASGHLHQGLVRRIGEVGHVWAPSTAFRAASARVEGADTRLGYTVFDLCDDGTWSARLVHPPGLTAADLSAYKQGGRYAFLKDVPEARSDEAWELNA